jgi:hypothetical protein
MAYTDIDKSELHFQTKTYTANGSANRLITLDGSEDMQPDWVWLKNRNQAVTNDLYDSVRGATKYISSDQTTAEATNPDGLIAFNTNGFTVDTSWGNISSGDGYVAWCWKAGGTASSNTDGSITSTVSANTTSGFSIVSYTGTGSDGATVGHGLGATPACIIIKNRTDSSSAFWCVYHQGSFVSQSDPGVLYINSTVGRSADTNVFGLSTVTINSNVFSLGNYNGSNGSSDNMIAYCFVEKKGFSKFGKYTGNGSTNGTFVYTGFRPAFVLTKASSSTGQWIIHDTARDPYNQANRVLYPSLSNAEENNISDQIDILSNGFKIKATGSAINGSGVTYIYMAFAENPFATSTGIPGLAR